MADILKSLPFLTVEEYKWGYSSSFIRLMAYDQSRIKYLKNKDGKNDAKQEDVSVFTANDVLASFGVRGEKKDATTVRGDIKDLIRQSQTRKKNVNVQQ
ncbi:MAG: hypothetical protein II604_09240 [Bacteroidales bacterium]|nr:hypothetical protein [Bacteroidales bacterium]